MLTNHQAYLSRSFILSFGSYIYLYYECIRFDLECGTNTDLKKKEKRVVLPKTGMNLKISIKSHKVFFILPWLLFVVSGVLSFDCLLAVPQFHGTSRNKRGRDVKELKLGMVTDL